MQQNHAQLFLPAIVDAFHDQKARLPTRILKGRLVVNKAAFIRSFPEATSPKVIAEEGKSVGIHFPHTYAAVVKSIEAGRKIPKMSSTVEDLLYATAAEMGIANAIQLLEKKRATVKAALARFTP